MPRLLSGILLLLAVPAFATSLFDESSYQPIVAQKVEHEVGDLLTVLIYETSTASNEATTDTNTDVDVGWNYNTGNAPGNRNFSGNNEFAGGGQVNRSGKVIASISVTIVAIEENGDYRISGEQKIKLNNESQSIRVSGVLRPDDVSNDNSVLSTRIANADIEFEGQGLLSTTEKPGLITRFFNWLF